MGSLDRSLAGCFFTWYASVCDTSPASVTDRLLPFDQRWVLRPQQQRSERLGPAEWSLALLAIPARRPGPTSGSPFLSRMEWVPPFDVEALASSVQQELPEP